MPASKNFVRYNTLPPPSFDNSINFTMLGVTYTLGDFDENTKNSTKKPKKGFYRPKITLLKIFLPLYSYLFKVRILFYIKVFGMD